MAGVAAVGWVWAYRKQRLDEADGLRADGEQRTQSYSTAAEQLGHEKAAVRLAGVFAMARLADDWPQQSQQCIDVLCAYLRMPAGTDTDLSEGEVRASIVRTIGAHLRDDAEVSWVTYDFDFTGAALHDAGFGGVMFSGVRTSFAKARFAGLGTHFSNAKFSGKSVPGVPALTGRAARLDRGWRKSVRLFFEKDQSEDFEELHALLAHHVALRERGD